MNKIIDKLKIVTNYQENIIYRKKTYFFKNIYIIYNETLISSSNISNFIIRSLNHIYIPTYNNILNKINNFKYKEISTFDEISYYLNSGFTILLINKNKYLALETKKDLSRGVTTPTTENTSRGPLDSFTENIELNLGLLKRRIKNNNLWTNNYKIGKYTKTTVSLVYINTIAKQEIVTKIDSKLKKICIDGILSSGAIKNLIENENKNIFPNIMSTEKPYTACKYLLQGNVIILVDNDPFILILPVSLNDFFISEEDEYGKNINVSMTRIIRYIALFITLFTPAIYLALTTFSQEIIPTSLLISIAAQRESVPFSTFIECLIMIIAFELLKESDLKLPSYASSAISIVGALILGEAAVNAGIVSPIMIIVVAITAISSLTFIEPEIVNSIRLYRLIFMIGATTTGTYGILLTSILFLIKLASSNFLSLPYLYPFAPNNNVGLKDSLIKYPIKKTSKRNPFLSKNKTKNITEENYD